MSTHDTEKLKSKNGSDRDLTVDIAETVDEKTAVHTPSHSNRQSHAIDSEARQTDIEKAIKEQQDGLPAPIEIPDGGRAAWLTVFGAWCILFSTFGMTNAYGVYQDFYVRHFLSNETPSAIGWIGSVQLFFQFSMGAVTGKLFDAGYFHSIMIAGSLLYVFCYFMLSLAQPGHYYQVFLAQGIGAGVALGLLFLPAIGVISHHFRNRRSFAMGIVVSGSSFGGLVFPVMINKLIEHKGFGWATRAAAFLCTGLMAIAIACMRTRLPPRNKMPQGEQPPLPSVKELVTDWKYTIATVGAFFNMLGLFTPIFYIQLYAISHGVDPNLAFYTIAILNGASVIGRIVPNFFGDIWGAFNALIVCTFACAVIGISMLGATSTGGIIAICALYGLFSGAYISLLGPLFATLSNHVSEMGIRMGLAFSVLSFAGLGGTPIMGALLTSELKWSRPIAFSGACVFFGGALFIIARAMTARQRNTWKV
ncbi:MFS general substrate transporter [Serendipita vermifera]|nr:MFS general substrate transporter [Serendipita vermifera]